jgi:hypothetical protein
MKRLVSKIAFAMVACVALAGTALAEDKKAEDKKEDKKQEKSGDVSAEVKAGTGVEKHEIVGEAQSFPSGTMVWVWSRVNGANGTDIKHVWKEDGKEVWTATLPVGSNRWSTQSRRSIKSGSWEVEVVAADGKSLGSVKFTVEK